MNAVFQDAGTHLNVFCEGIWDPVEVTDVARRVRARADALHHTRVFVDWSAVSAPKDRSYVIHVGEDIAALLPPPIKLAVLQRKALISRLTEKVARTRGADVLIHHDRDHLLAWLLGAG